MTCVKVNHFLITAVSENKIDSTLGKVIQPTRESLMFKYIEGLDPIFRAVFLQEVGVVRRVKEDKVPWTCLRY